GRQVSPPRRLHPAHWLWRLAPFAERTRCDLQWIDGNSSTWRSLPAAEGNDRGPTSEALPIVDGSDPFGCRCSRPPECIRHELLNRFSYGAGKLPEVRRALTEASDGAQNDPASEHAGRVGYVAPAPTCILEEELRRLVEDG